MLAKGNQEEKMESIFLLLKNNDNILNKKDFSEIISGIFRLLMRKAERFSFNTRVLAEELTNKFFNKINNDSELKNEIIVDEFQKWINKEENKNKINYSCSNINQQIKHTDVSKTNLSIFVESVMINEKILNFDSIISYLALNLETFKNTFYLHFVNVIDAAEIFKRNSLLGIMNKSQILQSFKDIYQLISKKVNVEFKEVN